MQSKKKFRQLSFGSALPIELAIFVWMGFRGWEHDMRKDRATDYETYKEIMGELLRPIEASGLDIETLKRLYESKLVYLENLRVTCFMEVNQGGSGHFTMEDYRLILQALGETNRHLRDLMMVAITTNLAKRRAGGF
jgi:hypothetical protein